MHRGRRLMDHVQSGRRTPTDWEGYLTDLR